MASNPPGQCCVEKVFHEGTPVGKQDKIFGLDTYVVGESKSRFIVIATDIYGFDFNNVRLVADKLASGGYTVYIPDILKGDPVKPGDDLPEWLKSHTPEVTTPIYSGFLTQLRGEVGSSAFIGSIGYCFGAKYVIQQSTAEGVLDASAIAHPSFVSIDEVAAVKKPLLIAAAETDPIFTVELRHQTEAKLAEIKARYQLTLFSGVSHGYSVRGDLSVPEVRYAAWKTLTDQIAWFNLF